jgi:hypothetical protein
LRCANLLTSQILHAVGGKIRASVSEDEGSEPHDGGKAREVENCSLRILAIENTGEEELCSLVDFRPKSFLESFFGCSYDGSFLIRSR